MLSAGAHDGTGMHTRSHGKHDKTGPHLALVAPVLGALISSSSGGGSSKGARASTPRAASLAVTTMAVVGCSVVAVTMRVTVTMGSRGTASATLCRGGTVQAWAGAVDAACGTLVKRGPAACMACISHASGTTATGPTITGSCSSSGCHAL